MTREEAISALDKWREGSDREKAHQACDTILTDFLADNGFEDVAVAWWKAYNRVDWWYA